jgi:CheY-like chemotaxis protein
MAKLLIVDDNAGLREGICTYFEDQGHTPVAAGSVSEAMDRFKEQVPDLVLSDLLMDDGSGLQLRKQIKRLGLPQDPYFILFTAHPSHESAAEAHREGVDLYLSKPFQLPALELAVSNGLRKRPLAQHPVYRASEEFYHDFFLTLNPVLPRLLMMMEGRYGQLSPGQQQAVGGVVETWRKLVWTMADFHARLHEPRPAGAVMARWHGPAALNRILERLRPDLEAAGLDAEALREARLPVAQVHAGTAEALMEALVLRLAAFSAPGAHLSFSWERAHERLILVLRSDLPHPALTPELRRVVALLPPVLPLLDQAGVHLEINDDAGPWRMSFELGL